MHCARIFHCFISLQVYRLDTTDADISMKPIVASFTNQTDKWEVLCLARVSKNGVVTITEDIPCRRTRSRQEQSGDRSRHISVDQTQDLSRHISVDKTQDRSRHLSVERAKSRESSYTEYTTGTNYSSETETNMNYSVFDESTCESYRTDV